MFKKNHLSLKDTIKKINYELNSSFFSLEEFKQLSFRKAHKVIKLIAKIKRIKLKNRDAKLLVHSLHALERSEGKFVQPLSRLFTWIKETIIKKTPDYNNADNNKVQLFTFLYRRERKQVFRT